MLAMDEMIDNGMIMESDSAQVISRVALRSDDIPLGEQTVAQVKIRHKVLRHYLNLSAGVTICQGAAEMVTAKVKWTGKTGKHFTNIMSQVYLLYFYEANKRKLLSN